MVPLDSPEWESQMGELDLPSTLDTFEVARDPIAMISLLSLAQAVPA